MKYIERMKDAGEVEGLRDNYTVRPVLVEGYLSEEAEDVDCVNYIIRSRAFADWEANGGGGLNTFETWWGLESTPHYFDLSEEDVKAAAEAWRDSTPAAFWVYEPVGGRDQWVMIRLKVGEKATFEDGGPHEEGHSYSGTTYENAGTEIRRVYWSRWRDCDGPGESSGEDYCKHEDLAARKLPGEGLAVPVWVNMDRRQRDYYAEAMGY